MHRLAVRFTAILILGLFGTLAIAKEGTLIVLGGGRESPNAAKALIAAAGGSDAKIVVLAHSREELARSAGALKAFFEENGAKNVVAPTETSEEALLSALKDAKGVFMSGGNQNLFTSRISPSGKVAGAIRRVFKSGGVVSGTSAGASLIGEFMPTGEDKEGDPISANPSMVAPGLNVWPGMIIDQHFLKRGRLTRLLAMLETKPGFEGIGIDERAYIVVRGKSIEAFEGQSILIRRSKSGEFKLQIIRPKQP